MENQISKLDPSVRPLIDLDYVGALPPSVMVFFVRFSPSHCSLEDYAPLFELSRPNKAFALSETCQIFVGVDF